MKLTKISGADNGAGAFTFSVSVQAENDDEIAGGGASVSLCNDEPDPDKAVVEVVKVFGLLGISLVPVAPAVAPAKS